MVLIYGHTKYAPKSEELGGYQAKDIPPEAACSEPVTEDEKQRHFEALASQVDARFIKPEHTKQPLGVHWNDVIAIGMFCMALGFFIGKVFNG